MGPVDIASLVLRLAVGCWLLWRLRPVPVVAPGTPRAALAVVVPARDESSSLPHLLASLQGQLRDGDELVVVDDHSGDDTAALAVAGGARVLPAPPLAPGWTGKAWAVHAGVGATANPVLVLLDADVRLHPGALDGVAAALDDAGGGLLSVAPHHVTERPYERLSALCNTVAVMGTGAATPLAAPRGARGAFGPCLVTTRADHDAVGGHAAVRSSSIEDVDLARAYLAADLPVTALGGRGAVDYRMYPDGLRSLFDGWTKNLVAGAGATRPLTTVGVVAWISLLLQASWWPVAAATGRAAWVLAVVAYVAVAAQVAWALRRLGRFGTLTPLAFPVLVAFFVAVFVRSAVRLALSRPVAWKGREGPAS